MCSTTGAYNWERHKRNFWLSKLKKISAPYTVFPRFFIGAFPDEVTMTAPVFWMESKMRYIWHQTLYHTRNSEP